METLKQVKRQLEVPETLLDGGMGGDDRGYEEDTGRSSERATDRRSGPASARAGDGDRLRM
jgi:hypothetical protein